MTTETRPKARLRWVAGTDRVAHASSQGHPRTLCGELVVEERFAWPAERRCMGCQALVAEIEADR